MGKLSDLLPLDRYRTQARQHALTRSATAGSGLLPTYNNIAETTPNDFSETGGLSEKDVRGVPHGPATAGGHGGLLGGGQDDRVRPHISDPEKSTHNNVEEVVSPTASPPAPPPDKSEAPSAGDPTLGPEANVEKPPITTRMLNGTKRFGVHFKNVIFHSWVNVLLVFVPLGIIVKAIGLNASVVFAINAIAIIPLAGLLSHATEAVASRLGDTLGALLNVSFGNAVELIIFIIALVKDEIRIVQASLLGSILANLLLILGMAFLLGGLRFREQVYNSTVTQMSACLLSLSVTSLILPTAFHASFNASNAQLANQNTLKISRAISIVLLIVYILYLVFQLKSHAYMYESTPQEVIDEESHPGVLADIMNSSSSSDDSSSSDSSDSDTSGSVVTTSKRVRRMFKNRRRRKSNASGSTTRTSSVIASTSSPSVDHHAENYWDSHHHSTSSANRPHLGVIASGDEADADVADIEDENLASPRIRDFGQAPDQTDAVSPEPRKRRKKNTRRKQKKRHGRNGSKDALDDAEKAAAATGQAKLPQPAVKSKVEFADIVEPLTSQHEAPQAPGRLSFNMRQLSSRVPYRPALPKMLSNNVFVQPAPHLTPVPPRSDVDGTALRRTSSLPDRLNQTSVNPNIANRTGPLPPFQHQRVHFRPNPELSTGTAEISAEEDEKPTMSRTAAVVLLLATTALVAVCAEFMVDAIPGMIANSPLSQAFVGLILLPIVGNAAEHVTAVTVATKNKMDLAIGVAVGSSIQIALFVTPLVVLLGWILNTDMSLYFNLFETVSLVATAFVINFLILDGRSNYLEGSLLIAVYVIIAVVAYFYPSSDAESVIGGAGTS